MQRAETNHYAILGLDRSCTDAQIRAAYRVLAKLHHPDINHGSADAVKHTQALNAAYEILSDASRRLAYDVELDTARRSAASPRTVKAARNITQDLHLRIEDCLRGATLEVRVKDPANPDGAELYHLVIPPETAPGTRFRIPRFSPFDTSHVLVRVKVRPDFRFKVRGSDLRCDIRISCQRAAQGGWEMVRGATGSPVRIRIPQGIVRGEIISVPGEGLPKPRGGRGDLLLRIIYRPDVRITRASR